MVMLGWFVTERFGLFVPLALAAAGYTNKEPELNPRGLGNPNRGGGRVDKCAC
jgi:hypothetical protein